MVVMTTFLLSVHPCPTPEVLTAAIHLDSRSFRRDALRSRHHHQAVHPPSTRSACPVTIAAAGLARYAAAAATSSISATRPRGMRERMRSRHSGSARVFRANSVATKVGATAFTVIL